MARRAAVDPDHLGGVEEGTEALGGAVEVGPRRVELQDDEIRPVAVAVGEAPGDVAAAAGGDRRQAGEGHPGHPVLSPTTFGRPDERRPVPDVGHPEAEVHVVGEESMAVRGVAAGDRPVVAAGRVRLLQLPLAPLGGPGEAGGGERRRPGGRLAQIDDLGTGQGGHREEPADERRVPLGPRGDEEVEERRGQGVVHQPQARLAGDVRRLEVEEHGLDDEDRVLRPPGGRPAAQEGVLEGRRAQSREPGVDPRGIGVEHRPLLRRGLLIDGLGHGAEAVHPVAEVELQERGAEDLGELASGPAAQEVHLEEALLGMEEAGRPGDVDAVGAADRGDPQGVALDRHRRREAGEGAAAVELRQALAHPAPQVEAGGEEGDDQESDEDEEDQAEPPQERSGAARTGISSAFSSGRRAVGGMGLLQDRSPGIFSRPTASAAFGGVGGVGGIGGIDSGPPWPNRPSPTCGPSSLN